MGRENTHRGHLNFPVALAIPSRGEYTAVIYRPTGLDSFSVLIFSRNAGTIALIAAFALSSSVLAAEPTAKPPAAELAGVQQQSSPAHPHASTANPATVTLPQECLHPDKTTEPLRELLEAIADHPTAGAYNTLGALYAQQSLDACAVGSFEASLRLEPQNWEAHYNLGLALMKRGDRKKAEGELREAIAEKPDSASAHHALAELYEAENELSGAAAEYQSVLHADAHFPLGAADLARALSAQQKFAEAIGALQQALSLSPAPDQIVPIRVALGVTYAESGDQTKAIETLRQLVADHPESADAHLALGTVYAQQEQVPSDDAATEFREALRIDPTMPGANLALSRALLVQKKFSDALAAVQNYIQRQPNDAEAYHLEGLIYEGQNRWDKANESLSKAARLASADYEIRKESGLALAHSGRRKEAIQEFQAAEKISPQELEPHQQLASLYDKTGKIDQAKTERARLAKLSGQGQASAEAGRLNEQANKLLAAGNARAAADSYRRALQLVPNDAQMHYNLSLALDRLGETNAEVKELRRAVELDPNLAVGHNQLGLIALGAGHQEEAEHELKLALQIDPKLAEALNNLGVLYTQQGKDSEAAPLFQQATQFDPSYSRAYVNLGLTLARHGRYDDAEKQFHAALQADPNDASAFGALGMLQAKTGRSQDAIASFRKSVELQPNSAEAHLNLGIALVDGYDRVGGLKEFQEAARLDPKSAAAHLNLGRFYFEASKYNEARKELEAAIALQPNFASALYFLSLVERQSGNVERSAQLLQKVVQVNPDQADAQFILGQDLDKLGRPAEAVTHWKLALQADPNESQALYALARQLDRTHDPQAQEYHQRFDELQKEQQITDRVQQLGNFAMQAAAAQNWPQAIEQTQEALQSCGDCAEAIHLHRNLGIFYCKTGKFDEGEAELKKALALNPNDADARKAVDAVESLKAQR